VDSVDWGFVGLFVRNDGYTWLFLLLRVSRNGLFEIAEVSN
jgi:hypothetical protein